MLGKYLKNLEEKQPLIHNITNYVTVNDVANILLASNAKPIMSDEPKDVEDITSICAALNINIGTLNERSIEAMFLAGEKAKSLGHIVLLDPVGAGASKLRTDVARDIIKRIKPDIIRGNISEIKAIAAGRGTTKGVEADEADMGGETVKYAKNLAKELDCIIAITGPIDFIANSEKCYVIKNGDEIMSVITGAGCQLSALMTAFAAANTEELLEGCAASVCTMGLAGEKAKERMSELDGNSSYRNYLIDAIYNMDKEQINLGAKYEVK